MKLLVSLEIRLYNILGNSYSNFIKKETFFSLYMNIVAIEIVTRFAKIIHFSLFFFGPEVYIATKLNRLF